jgi:hypothetical protein
MNEVLLAWNQELVAELDAEKDVCYSSIIFILIVPE